MSRFSPLLDPIILDTDLATNPPSIWDRLPKNINWTNLFINFIIPIGFFFFIAFTLKARYDAKKELHDQYLVV